MAAPFPPQGNQSQHTARPVKVYAEQFRTGQPVPVGVITTAPTGEAAPPHVIGAGGIYQPVHEGDWVISSRYSGRVTDVMSDEEFTERFGGQAQPVE